MKVLILGGYGVFGGRLAQLLLADGIEVIIAGRSVAKASAFIHEFGGTAVRLDRSDLTAVSGHLAPGDIVVDAVGPFQDYKGYGLAEAVIAAGCHYLDLSDSAEFTCGIATLDAQARAQNVVALSGLSSVPALSSAVVDELTQGLAEVTLIDTAILPGNRAPRGMSVMAAILSQVGRPLAEWRGGKSVKSPGWSQARMVKLPKGLTRPASNIAAPDLVLFPEHYAARSVRFSAGLELGVMHHGLRVLGWLHRKGMLRRLDQLTAPLRRVAQLLNAFGTDQGGMSVTVAGRDATGVARAREWRLHMGAGKGPFVPAVPALLVIRQIAKGQFSSGAKPALGCFSLAEAEAVLETLSGHAERRDIDRVPIFERAVGDDAWGDMPASYRAGHDLWDRHEMRGVSSVERGTGLLARVIAAAFRFPPARQDTPVTVTMERRDDAEHWIRDFDGVRFSSVLTYAGPGRVYERFGPFTFELDLPVANGRMQMIVRRGWFLGALMPNWALPHSDTEEFDEDVRFNFSVRLSAPIAGLIVHYRGWLEPR